MSAACSLFVLQYKIELKMNKILTFFKKKFELDDWKMDQTDSRNKFFLIFFKIFKRMSSNCEILQFFLQDQTIKDDSTNESEVKMFKITRFYIVFKTYLSYNFKLQIVLKLDLDSTTLHEPLTSHIC